MNPPVCENLLAQGPGSEDQLRSVLSKTSHGAPGAGRGLPGAADPIITDVHTDVGGDLPVAREPSVLHVGTHLPRAMVVTVDSCSGPRAYVGIASLFQQKLESGLVRLTDEEWESTIYSTESTPEWLDSVLTR